LEGDRTAWGAATEVEADQARPKEEVRCNWHPIRIDGTEGQPRWSFHWIVRLDENRYPPLYLREHGWKRVAA
jgi:hypothetical protein